jgi:FkbM family methyltransferase
MKRTIKLLINRVVSAWGMELAYSHQITHPETSLDWLRLLNIQTVLDVGANIGQFARDIAEKLPQARIVSFEPLRDAYAELERAARVQGFEAHNFALGEEDGRAVIRRARNSQSSSILPMLDLHREAFAGTDEVGTEEVEVRRLDSLALGIEPNLLVKLDVQGFEDKVIAGGRETISRAACVLTEVSFEELYEGQPLFDDINAQLREMGFRFRGTWWQLPDPRDGRILQADAIYTRR